jgi:hypothetical protein
MATWHGGMGARHAAAASLFRAWAPGRVVIAAALLSGCVGTLYEPMLEAESVDGGVRGRMSRGDLQNAEPEREHAGQ